MKLSVECQIDGLATLEAPLVVLRGDTEYTFTRSADGRLASLRIVRPLPCPEKAWVIFKEDEHGTPAGIDGRIGDGTFEDIVEEFKQIESMLAFSVQIQRLDWQCPIISLIPETSEEAERVQILNFRRSFQSPSQPQHARASELSTIIKYMDVFEPLTVVQAFWREGRNEMEQLRFIPSFVNFFYVLEAMYGNGQCGKREILREFGNSDDLRNSTQSFLKSPTTNGSPHRDNLSQMLAFRQKRWDADGLLYLLVETRGEVHHYVPTSRRRYGTPFRNNEYHTVALAAMYLATVAIDQQVRQLSKEVMAKSSPDR